MVSFLCLTFTFLTAGLLAGIILCISLGMNLMPDVRSVFTPNIIRYSKTWVFVGLFLIFARETPFLHICELIKKPSWVYFSPLPTASCNQVTRSMIHFRDAIRYRITGAILHLTSVRLRSRIES